MCLFRRLLVTLLLVSIISIIQCTPTGSSSGQWSSKSSVPTKEAVLLTDAKLDDKMALYYLDQKGDYGKLHVILHGVHDQEAAHGSMKDFQAKMYEQAALKGYPHAQTPIVYYRGRNPLRDAAPHERFFAGCSEDLLYDQAEIADYFLPESRKIDLFHIGPTHDDDIQHTVDSAYYTGKQIELLHSTAGYNNSQKPEKFSDGIDEKRHIQNLQRKDRNARTVLIQTKTTFDGPQGGTQSYDWLKERVPQDHLDPSGKDEWFHLAQLRHADEIIQSHLGVQEYQRKELPFYYNDSTMQDMMWRARLKANPRDEDDSDTLVQIFQERQQTLRDLQAQGRGDFSVIIARLSAAIVGFKDPCQAETCDANHIAVVLDAHNNRPSRFVHAHAENHRNIRQAGVGEEVHGHTLINQPVGRTTTLLAKVFHPIFASSTR